MIHAGYQKFKGAKPTAPDIEGPFYLPGAPERPDGVIGSPPAGGEPVVIHGRVTLTDGTPLAAVLDVWQADEAGVYDEHGFKLRGKLRTGDGGEYRLETVPPGDYKISDTEFRCAHVHVKLTAGGCKPLTTQLYFAGDKYNASDHWFSAERVVGAGGRFDFVLEPA